MDAVPAARRVPFGETAGDLLRTLSAGDSLEELTALLHRAYARLAGMGFNYTAVDQGVETTRRRATKGTCLVAERGGRLVGTLSMHRGAPDEETEIYRDPGAVVLEQFAVEPELQACGIGGALMREAERRAREEGAREVLGDTSEGATHLIRWYESLGWRVVGTVRWRGKTYRSVLLSKAVGP